MVLIKTTIVAVVAAVLAFFSTASIIAQGQEQEEELNQVLIQNNISSITPYGKYNNTQYINQYNVKNLFDNLTNSWSFWSEFKESGFDITLSPPIKYPICKVDIGVFSPKNTTFAFGLNNQTFNGILDTTTETIDIPQCVKDVTTISADFIPDVNLSPEKKWTTLSEIKLYTNESTTGTFPPPEPPVCPTGTYWDPEIKKCVDIVTPAENITKIWLNNTKVLMDVTNSELEIVIGPNTSLKLPEQPAEQPQPQPQPVPEEEEPEPEEEEEEEEEEDEDKN